MYVALDEQKSRRYQYIKDLPKRKIQIAFCKIDLTSSVKVQDQTNTNTKSRINNNYSKN